MSCRLIHSAFGDQRVRRWTASRHCRLSLYCFAYFLFLISVSPLPWKHKLPICWCYPSNRKRTRQAGAISLFAGNILFRYHYDVAFVELAIRADLRIVLSDVLYFDAVLYRKNVNGGIF